MIQLFLLLCPHKLFQFGGESYSAIPAYHGGRKNTVFLPPWMNQHKFFDDNNSVHLKNGTQDVHAYDLTMRFNILQENPSLKQTETLNSSENGTF